MFVLRMKSCVCDTSKRGVEGSYEKKGCLSYEKRGVCHTSKRMFVIGVKGVFLIRVKGVLDIKAVRLLPTVL